MTSYFSIGARSSMDECSLTVREANLNDIKYVVDIERKSFKYPYPATAFFTLMTLYPKYFLISEYCGKVVGYVVAGVDKDGSGHIISIAVDPEYRGRGFGKSLMKLIESRLLKDGINKFKLEVSVSNYVAIRMYELLGYKICKVLKGYYPDGEDAYLMYKEVSSSS